MFSAADNNLTGGDCSVTGCNNCVLPQGEAVYSKVKHFPVEPLVQFDYIYISFLKAVIQRKHVD